MYNFYSKHLNCSRARIFTKFMFLYSLVLCDGQPSTKNRIKEEKTSNTEKRVHIVCDRQ